MMFRATSVVYLSSCLFQQNFIIKFTYFQCFFHIICFYIILFPIPQRLPGHSHLSTFPISCLFSVSLSLKIKGKSQNKFFAVFGRKKFSVLMKMNLTTSMLNLNLYLEYFMYIYFLLNIFRFYILHLSSLSTSG